MTRLTRSEELSDHLREVARSAGVDDEDVLDDLTDELMPVIRAAIAARGGEL